MNTFPVQAIGIVSRHRGPSMMDSRWILLLTTIASLSFQSGCSLSDSTSSLPKIEYSKAISDAEVTFSEWKFDGRDLICRMQIGSGSTNDYQFQYHLYGKNGDKIDDGIWNVPVIGPGETAVAKLSKSTIKGADRIRIAIGGGDK